MDIHDFKKRLERDRYGREGPPSFIRNLMNYGEEKAEIFLKGLIM